MIKLGMHSVSFGLSLEETVDFASPRSAQQQRPVARNAADLLLRRKWGICWAVHLDREIEAGADAQRNADMGDMFTFAITSDPSGFFEIVGDNIRVAAGANIDFETAQHRVSVP